MKSLLLSTFALTVLLAGCGSSSSDSKNSGQGPIQTVTDLNMADATNTSVCNDSTKPLNSGGTFEQISKATNGSLQLTTRIRFEDDGNGQGILVMEISCASGNASASNKGRVSYRRQGNLVELTQALQIKAESTNSSTNSCSTEFNVQKMTLTVSSKNSCLQISAGGEQSTFVPSQKGI